MRTVSEAVKAALLAPDGRRQVDFRFDIFRNGVKYGEVLGEGSILLDVESSIQRTAQLTFRRELDWIRDTIRPYLLLRLPDGTRAEFPLGVFLPVSPARKVDDKGLSYWEVSCYEQTMVLREDCLTEPLYLAAGTKYLDAVESILAGAGLEYVMVRDGLEAALPIEREFDEGLQKLEVVNTLLAEVNFSKLYCDADGSVILSRYREPSAEQISFTYHADMLSVIQRTCMISNDYLSVPNVFIAKFSNPELDTPYRSVYINDRPDSPVSTISRGRKIVKILDPPDVVASQEDLDEFVAKEAFQASQVFETVEFQTALMPIHESGDVIAIKHPDFSGVYQEVGWELPLEAGASMRHSARRIVAYG